MSIFEKKIYFVRKKEKEIEKGKKKQWLKKKKEKERTGFYAEKKW